MNSETIIAPQSAVSKKWQALIAGAVFLALFLVFATYKYVVISAAMAANSAFGPPPEAVTTVVVSAQEWPTIQTAVGSVASPNGMTLSVEESGTVKKINVASGTKVEEGQILVELDVSVEEAQLAGAKARQELARHEIDRIRPLRERNAVSKSDLDKAEAELRSANAEVASLTAVISRKRITAPFSGYAGIRKVNVGQYVAAGAEILPFFSLKPVFVDFALPQEAVFTVKQGQDLTVTVPGQPHKPIMGQLTAVNPQVSETTRNVSMQATVSNEEELLRPGMFVQVSLELGSPAQVIPVPASSISYAPYGDTVYVVDTMRNPAGDEYLGVRAQVVKLGAKRGEQVAVLEGLSPGDQVVTSGVFKLRPGAAVAINNDFAPSNSLAPNPADI